MRRSIAFLLLFLFLFAPGCSRFGISNRNAPEGSQLPVDPRVRTGKLINGLTYYIRNNSLPAGRIELRLAIDAGSVLEEEDQRGLAHFVEHMAFNGTEHFEKQELVNFLESIGMRFGADLNASTGFDATNYMLQVPTDSSEALEKAFLILRDWASGITFDPEEVLKERGVIIEEWRLRKGARSRMMDKQLPVLLSGSRYAERLPIGKVEIVESATSEKLKDFYTRWYRPDLMAIVAVGDFDPEVIEDYIRKNFSEISFKKTSKRPVYEVPDHKETLYSPVSDPEATQSSVSIYIKHPPETISTTVDYRNMLASYLFSSMLNNRLSDLPRKPDPPFLSASAGYGGFVRSKDAMTFSAAVEDNRITDGLRALVTEAERARRFGFTSTELSRVKQDFLSYYETAWNEREKTESDVYASEYVSHFLERSPFPGIDFEYKFARETIPSISLEKVNNLAKKLISGANRVVLANSPEKEGIRLPDQKELSTVIDEAMKTPVTAYVDSLPEGDLLDVIPAPGKVDSEKTIDKVGVTEWVLSNGARIILKPTDFKNDQILMYAYSPGGHSVVPDSSYVPAITASAVVAESGLGKFSHTDMQKKLAGKQISVRASIGDLTEIIRGESTPRDLETFFQAVYLNFTALREDSVAYRTLVDRLISNIRNRTLQPESAFQDTLSLTIWDYHPRSRPMTTEWLKEMDMDESIDIFRDRFRDPGDFTFIFVGAFELANFKPLMEKYIGGLPDSGRREKWKDIGMRYTTGVVEKTVRKGIEPKSLTSIQFTGPFEWSRENSIILETVTGVLNISLREKVREELGGTYNVSVGPSITLNPVPTYRIGINFGSDPGRTDELTSVVFEQINSLSKPGTVEKYLPQVKEMFLRSREVRIKENPFWLDVLNSYYFRGDSPEHILEYPSTVEKITPDEIRKAAERYFDMKNYVKVVLYPEKQ